MRLRKKLKVYIGVLIKLILFIAVARINCADFNPIRVLKAGLLNIARHDIGLVFYLTVENTGAETYHIVTKMIECCESITNEDTDCEFMHLLGGNMGYILPSKTKNVTLLFPNMYVHNRRGECQVAVWYRSRMNVSKDVKYRIPFNTYISGNKVPSTLTGYFHPSELSVCNSPDQDPLDKCLPVNCHMKYSGFRSYYNPIINRCEKIPICMSDPKKAMPDVAYVPMSNACRDLETAITEDDVHFLTRNILDSKWKEEPPPLITQNLRCHHGHVDNESGFCTCDPGWTSAPFDRDQFNPSTLLYHMCTIQEKPVIYRRIFQLISTHYPTLLIVNILMSICLIVMIFFGHSFIINYEIARSKNKGTN